jgi:hypothetical protein
MPLPLDIALPPPNQLLHLLFLHPLLSDVLCLRHPLLMSLACAQQRNKEIRRSVGGGSVHVL